MFAFIKLMSVLPRRINDQLTFILGYGCKWTIRCLGDRRHRSHSTSADACVARQKFKFIAPEFQSVIDRMQAVGAYILRCSPAEDDTTKDRLICRVTRNVNTSRPRLMGGNFTIHSCVTSTRCCASQQLLGYGDTTAIPVTPLSLPPLPATFPSCSSLSRRPRLEINCLL